MIKKKRKREPIHISPSAIERAFEKVKQFQRLVEKGKSPEQIFKDTLRLILIEE